LREGDGLGRTSGIPSGFVKTISVVSLRTVPCHVTSQRERKSSSKLAWYALNVLRPSSIKVMNVGLRMLPLCRSDPLWLECPLFMLDVLKVVDSLVESSKCVATWIEQETEGPAQCYRNWTVRFGKPDGSVLSISMGVKGVFGTRWGSFSSSQATFGRDRHEIRQSKGLKQQILDLIYEKKKN
jgi:hypothetical protein